MGRQHGALRRRLRSGPVSTPCLTAWYRLLLVLLCLGLAGTTLPRRLALFAVGYCGDSSIDRLSSSAVGYGRG